MREFERVKEKIEVRLDTPQVLLLVAVALAIVGGAFGAGYMVGQRAAPVEGPSVVAAPEPREALEAEAAPEPLGEVEFQFPTTLKARQAGGGRKAMAPKVRLPGLVLTEDEVKTTPPVVKPVAEPPTPRALAKAPKPAPIKRPPPAAPAKVKAEPDSALAAPAVSTPRVAVVPIPPPPSKGARQAPAEEDAPPSKAPARAAVKPTPEEQPPEEQLAVVKVPEPKRAAPEAKAPEKKAPETKTPEKKTPEKKITKKQPEPKAAEPAKPRQQAARSSKKVKFTLQVKAAKDRVEADAFVASLRRQGYTPKVILADIPGKGRYYRVRIGTFDSREQARVFQQRYRKKTGAADAGFVTKL